MILVTFAGMMADAGAGPHVVHGPYDGLSRSENLSEVIEREHSLIHPMQMDDIGLLEFGQGGDVRSGVGYIYRKEVMLLEVVGFPDDYTFPNELPDSPK